MSRHKPWQSLPRLPVRRRHKWVLYFAVTTGQTQDVFVLPTTGERTPKPIVQSPFADVEPQLSLDGRWLAYASTETGRNDLRPALPTHRGEVAILQ